MQLKPTRSPRATKLDEAESFTWIGVYVRRFAMALAAILLVVLVATAARALSATSTAHRFAKAMQSADVETINTLYQRQDAEWSFQREFPWFDQSSLVALKPLSFDDLLRGRRRMTIQPAGHLSALPFYVTSVGVRVYESYVL